MPLLIPAEWRQLAELALLAWAVTATAIAFGAMGTARDWRRNYQAARRYADTLQDLVRHRPPAIIEVPEPLFTDEHDPEYQRLARAWKEARRHGHPEPV
jgi:hypothetical protein